jgi:uncharacterized membrane protein YbhN (UPF0104 family)
MKAQLISSLFTTVAPGELVSSGVSWHYLARERGNYAETGAMLVYLKLVGYAAIALLALAGVFLEPRLHGMHVTAISIVVLVVCTISSVPFWHGPSAAAAQRAAEALLGALPFGRWSKYLHSVPKRLLVLHELPRAQLVIPIVMAFVINLCGAVTIAFNFEAAGVQVPWHACLWIRAVLTVVQAVPVSIAGTGLRELTLVYLLGSIYGTPSAEVIIASLLILALNLIYGLLIGGVLFLLDRGLDSAESSSDDEAAA